MKKNISPEIMRDRSKEKGYQRLGTRSPRCAKCGETDPSCLIRNRTKIICYECSSIDSGRSPIEDHHPAGKKNDHFTVPVPGNDHRILSEFQRIWPETTLRNPRKSPLRRASAMLRGFLDILRLMIDRILGWIPEFMESLDEALTDIHGDQWWIKILERKEDE